MEKRNKYPIILNILLILLGGTLNLFGQGNVNVGSTSSLLKSAQINILCGNDSVLLSAENYYGQGIVEWQESIDTINWATIPETSGETFKFLPTQTKYYRPIIISSTKEPQPLVTTLVQIPPVANAGVDRTVGGKIMTLLGNQIEGSLGEWIIIKGDSGVVSEPNSPSTQFTGIYNQDYQLVWTVTNSCGQSSDTVEVKFEEIVSKDNFIVVDNTDSIKSDSTEIANGIFKIKFSDPNIAPFDSVMLIAVREDISFLRKVTSFTLQDSIYTFITEQGSFQDLFKSGVINLGDAINQGLMDESSTLKSASLNSVFPTRKTIENNINNTGIKLLYVETIGAEPEKILKSAQAGETPTSFKLSLPSIKIFATEDEAVTFSISDAYIKITPNFVVDYKYSFPATLTKLKIGANNAEFEYNFKTEIAATAARSLVGEKVILEVSKHIFFMAGVVPVDIIAKFAIKASCNLEARGSMRLEETKNYKLNMTALVEGDNISDLKLNFDSSVRSTTETNFVAQGELTSEFKIGPEISLVPYGIVSFSLNLPAKINMGICANTDGNWDANASIGFEGYLGAKAGIVINTYLFPKVEMNLFDFKYPLFKDAFTKRVHFPDKLLVDGGNFQSGTVGQKLNRPILVRVVGGGGLGIQYVPVRFETGTGNGTVTKTLAWTDITGSVSIDWTLGANPKNTLKISVLDCNNSDIKNSPMYVYANSTAATYECTNSNLAISILTKTGNMYPSVTGGALPYSYSTNGVDYINTIPQFDVTVPGKYSVYVKDNNQCTKTRTFEIKPIEACAASTLSFDVLIQPNIVTLTGKGGVPPYTYAIDGTTSFTATNIFTKLMAGKHTVYIKDGNGCTASKIITIESQNVASIKSIYPAQGSISVLVSGITFEWLAGNYAANQVYDLSLKKGSEEYSLIASDLSTTSFNYTTALSNSTSYSWKLAVKGNNGSIIDFREFTFTTASDKATTPLNPILVYPANGDATGIYLTFQWLAQEGDFKYDVYLDDQNASKLVGINLTNPQLTINKLRSGVTYYWKVKVKSTVTGESAISPVWSFTTNSTLGSAFEYWFNNNYEDRTYSKVPSQLQLLLNKSFSTDELQVGLNALHFRFKDTKGYWSSVISEFFHKLPVTKVGSREIAASEYWFDDDYSNRVFAEITPGQTITTNTGFDVSALQTGLHSYHVRYKDDAGQWSSVVSEFFHKLPALTDGDRVITACEYWFDDDFSNKVSTEITPGQTNTTNSGFDVSALQTGLHSYHVRYKDDAGRWSSVVSEFFHKLPALPEGDRLITACEYWFDDDFANKISTEITPGQTIATNEGFDVSALQTGLHSYHVRYKDDAGQWSSVVSEFFHKLPALPEGDRVITACEYWFDDDFTNKISTEITPGQTIATNEGFDVSALQTGLHSYHVRYKDDAGQWSSVVSEFFHKLPALPDGDRVITACEYWFDDDYTNKISTEITPGQTITTNEGFDVSSLTNGLHSYHVRYKDDAGQWSSVVSEFFHKLPVSSAQDNLITAYRYWFNRDEENIQIINLVSPVNPYELIRNISVAGLQTGYNTIHFQFKDIRQAWSSVVTNTFNLESLLVQDIALKTGWNISSTYIKPDNNDILSVFQPLIDDGKLRKVMDETGKTIENYGFFGGWQNDIGNLDNTRGYKVNLTAPATLSIVGLPVALPETILLKAGWNIIGYPAITVQSALSVVQPLINVGLLQKVMDEEGRTIEDYGFFGGWQNDIGDLAPGKGYKVLVNANSTLTIGGEGEKSATIIPGLTASSHFKPVFQGNGTDHANINLVELSKCGLMEGDEIGIFDGDLCVGSAMLTLANLAQNRISIPASANDELESYNNGFTPGSDITLKLYRLGREFPLIWQPVNNSNIKFDKNQSVFVMLKTEATIGPKEMYDKINVLCYPNPFSGYININITPLKREIITVEVFDMLARRVCILYQGMAEENLTLSWNGLDSYNNQLSSGVYLLKVNNTVKKLIMNTSF